jgi:ketopantoate reductase
LETLQNAGLRVTTFEGCTYHFQIKNIKGGDCDDDCENDNTPNTRSARVVSTEEGEYEDRLYEEQDFVFIATKAHQIESILPVLNEKFFGRNMAVVPCTNGIPWWFLLVNGNCQGWTLHSVDPINLLARTIPVNQVLGKVGVVSGNFVGNYEVWESRWPSSRNVLTIGEPFRTNSANSTGCNHIA